MFDAFGRGGVARTVVNLANHLARRRPVEVISLYRRREHPRFELAPEVRLTVLKDTRVPRGPIKSRLDGYETRLRPEPSETEMSLLTDLLLRRKLRSLRDGTLLTTRPSLHLAATRFTRPGVLRIGQDHGNFTTRYQNARQVEVLGAAVPKLDAYAVLTHADAEDYRRVIPGLGDRVRVIRNGLPWPVSAEPAPLDNKVVVTAGRLEGEKGLSRMLRAYAPLARSHPDWQLHIYGDGSEKESLEATIVELGLGEQAFLKGFTHDLRGVLASSGVYAMTSRREGFPMSLIEAMSTGLPAVAFDCPRGPSEIVDDGRNGRLLPDGDIDGFTDALRSLMDDADLRRRLGRQALTDAAAYDIESVVTQWEELIDEVASARAR
jgi:glycosyltransferase involved in cell wall biosynthesis